MGAEPLGVGTRRSGAGVTCLHLAEAAKLGWGRDLGESLLLH